MNSNFYGLIMTLLTLVITVILTMREVHENGIRFEVVIQPVREYTLAQKPHQPREDALSGKNEPKKQTLLKREHM